MHPIKDYFLIGDLQTAALVSKSGSIEWLCLPYFDSPSVFARVLDDEKGGTFCFDMDGYETSSKYIPYTAIVETLFAGNKGSFSVRDFMLPRPTEEVVPHYLIRSIRGVQGAHTIHIHFDPRPNYARQRAMIQVEGRTCSIKIEDRTLWLHLPKNARTSVLSGRGGLEIEVDIGEGETKDIILEYTVASRVKLQDRDFEEETITFWKNWITEGNFAFSREHLVRSAITLKLMQFYPTGGLIAAPTTSLPEAIGGVRNWDYRYVWIRDATFLLYAFSVLGFTEEAKKFFRFIEGVAEEGKRCEDGECDLDLAVMYTIWGQPLQGEMTMEHLSGYANSRPVRIGNGAAEQFQLDTYGSLIDAYYFMSKRGLKISENGKEVIHMLVRGIKTHWKLADAGMWESRSERQQFTYGKVMAWVGVERALRLSDELKLSPAAKKDWQALKMEIETWIWENCFDRKRGTFVQHPETGSQDATNYLMVLLFFLDRHKEETKRVVEQTRKELSRDDLFVYRYFTPDGLPGKEGAFLLCSFWQIAAMAATGEIDEAEALLKRFEGLMPESGLIAEEIDGNTGEYLGNFPQAFSHIGYIMAAYYVHRYKKVA